MPVQHQPNKRATDFQTTDPHPQQPTDNHDQPLRERGVFGLCCRQYTAGPLHSLYEEIQILQNCLTIPRQKLRRGGGNRYKQLSQSPFCKLLLRRRDFELPSMSLILLLSGPSGPPPNLPGPPKKTL